jgi:hypothetical protein
VLDDWSEIIPNQTEQTGIALHYEGPKTEAPQAILIATPSRSGATWSCAELINSLEQTMKLAKIRAVSPDQLDLAQALPMNVFSANSSLVDHMVSTAFSTLQHGTVTRGFSDD